MSAKVYIILGTPKSGRREILFDLIDGLVDKKGIINIYIHNEEMDFPNRSQLASLENTTIFGWENKLPEITSDLNEEDMLFIVTNGQKSPIGQLEMIKDWLEEHELELTRILSVIDCELLYKKDDLAPFFDALVYFSDHVFLNNRKDVPQKFIKELQEKFEKLRYPCQFELVKNNQAANPYEALENQPRRISHFFDPFEVEDMELDEENLPEGPFDIKAKDDKYMARKENGKRDISLPKIQDFLD